jgi:F-type H+-transporting ATPase subunit c
MKTVKLVGLVFFLMLAFVSPALAQATDTATHGTYVLSGAAVGAGLGAALAIIGAGYGFGRIGSAALESMARQPEIAARIQTGMIIIAALLEGATFFALLICFQLIGKGF